MSALRFLFGFLFTFSALVGAEKETLVIVEHPFQAGVEPHSDAKQKDLDTAIIKKAVAEMVKASPTFRIHESEDWREAYPSGHDYETVEEQHQYVTAETSAEWILQVSLHGAEEEPYQLRIALRHVEDLRGYWVLKNFNYESVEERDWIVEEWLPARMAHFLEEGRQDRAYKALVRELDEKESTDLWALADSIYGVDRIIDHAKGREAEVLSELQEKKKEGTLSDSSELKIIEAALMLKSEGFDVARTQALALLEAAVTDLPDDVFVPRYTDVRIRKVAGGYRYNLPLNLFQTLGANEQTDREYIRMMKMVRSPSYRLGGDEDVAIDLAESYAYYLMDKQGKIDEGLAMLREVMWSDLDWRYTPAGPDHRLGTTREGWDFVWETALAHYFHGKEAELKKLVEKEDSTHLQLRAVLAALLGDPEKGMELAEDEFARYPFLTKERRIYEAGKLFFDFGKHVESPEQIAKRFEFEGSDKPAPKFDVLAAAYPMWKAVETQWEDQFSKRKQKVDRPYRKYMDEERLGRMQWLMERNQPQGDEGTDGLPSE